ncbi:MAG: hypothetical protein ACJAS1_001856 [Oleiphilaceae bacterium]|jgi:hypothetical protein
MHTPNMINASRALICTSEEVNVTVCTRTSSLQKRPLLFLKPLWYPLGTKNMEKLLDKYKGWLNYLHLASSCIFVERHNLCGVTHSRCRLKTTIIDTTGVLHLGNIKILIGVWKIDHFSFQYQFFV